MIRDYKDEDWTLTAMIHDKARPIELKGSCDVSAFIPLAEDQQALINFQQSKKYVACIKEQIVGFVGIIGTEISWLYTDPDLFGKGVGRLLLQFALQKMNSTASAYVLEGNESARKLYQAEGFEIAMRFESKNNGHPCTVLKLALPV